MMISLRLIAFLSIAAAWCVGCADPLVDSWKTGTPPDPSPDNLADYEEVVQFLDDHSMTDTVTFRYAEYPGALSTCVDTYVTTGLTWSDSESNGVQTVSVEGAGNTINSRSGCADSQVNVANATVPPAPAAPPVRWTYHIRDDRYLTLIDAAGHGVLFERVRRQ